MAGPTLQLGVNGTGVDTLVLINEQLGLLRANLTGLKGSGKADLSGLTSAASEIRGMRAQLAEQNAGLRTSFAELAEAIKGGLTQAATETTKSGAKLRSAVAKERQSMQLEYEAMLKQGRDFSLAELNVIKDAGVKLTAAQAARVQEQNRLNAALKPDLSKGAFSNPLPSASVDAQVEAAWNAHNKAMAGRISATKAEAWVQAETASQAQILQARQQSFKGFSEIEKRLATERAAALKASVVAEASGASAGTGLAEAESARVAKLMVGSAAIAEAQRKATAAEAAGWADWKAKMQLGSLQIAEGQAKAAATVLAAADARKAKLMVGSAAIAEAQQAAANKEADAALKWKAKLQLGSLQIAEGFDEAAARVAAANGRYLAATEKAQLRTQVRARGALDSGYSRERADSTFGTLATSAAAAAPSLNALKKLHEEVGGSADVSRPKIKGLAAAMGDLHSAARGVASGFNAMFLTWGNLAPLLAGAALSNAFVQTVKQGASVEQTLSVIKNLSSETDLAVDGLRNRLLTLASNGPQGPLEIAKAMKALSLAGLDAAQVSLSVKDALNLSVVGELPVEKAAEQLVAVSTAYGYAAGQFGRVNDIISKSAAISMSSVAGMTESFRVSSVVAQQYGVTLEDTATQLALLANIGIRNQQAGTAVTQFYANMSGTTKKGADALKSLGIEATDAAGRMKPLTELVRQLNEALAKKTPKAQNEALEAIFNNRGQRDALAVLNASRKAAVDGQGNTLKDEAGNIITEFARVQKEINEAYGFAVVAMANLSLTAENQMKSVGAAFQGSLVRAFKELEPAILVVSQRMREVFNSGDFQATLVGLVSTVGNFIVVLVEHANQLKLAAAAWLIYKGAMIASTVFGAVATGLGVMGEALVASRAALNGAALGMTALRLAMGPIAFILGAAASAWLLYKTTSNSASITAAEVASTSAAQIIEAIEKENARLRARNQLLKDGNDQRSADIKLAAIQAQQEQGLKSQKAQTSISDQIKPLQSQLDEIDSRRKTKLADGSETLPAAALAERGRVQDKLNGLLTQQHLLDSQTLRDKLAIRNATGEQVRLQEEAVKLSGGSPKPPVTPAGTEKFGVDKPDGTRLGGIRTAFNAQESAMRESFSNQQKLLDQSHTGKLTSDTLYAIQSAQLAERQYAAETTILENFIQKSKGAIAEAQANNKGGKAQGIIEEIEADKKKYEARLAFMKEQATLRAAISDNKNEKQANDEIAKINEGVKYAREGLLVQQATATMSQKEIVYQEAYNRELEQTKTLAKAWQDQLALVQSDLDKTLKNFQGPADEQTVSALQAKVNELTSIIERLNGVRIKAADELGQVASDRLKSPWETMLESYKNTAQQMKTAYDEMVTGFITEGEKMWTTFLKGGKVSIDGLVNLVGDIVFKQVYQQQIAPFFAELGQKTASVLRFNPDGKNGPGATSSSLDLASNKTASSLTAMDTTGITPVTSGLQAMLYAIDAATAKLWSMSGGGGGTGWSAAVAKLFEGEGGNYSNEGRNSGGYTGEVPGNDIGLAYSKGDAFAYAKGDAFTNKVYSQPTSFKFKNGAGFSQGQLGEAGPEAVMPLKRGADGSLGVAATGPAAGGGGGTPVSVVIENNSGEKATVQKTTRADGSQEIRAIIGAAVQETAKSVNNNGAVATAIQGQYGMSRANGLPRR